MRRHPSARYLVHRGRRRRCGEGRGGQRMSPRCRQGERERCSSCSPVSAVGRPPSSARSPHPRRPTSRTVGSPPTPRGLRVQWEGGGSAAAGMPATAAALARFDGPVADGGAVARLLLPAVIAGGVGLARQSSCGGCSGARPRRRSPSRSGVRRTRVGTGSAGTRRGGRPAGPASRSRAAGRPGTWSAGRRRGGAPLRRGRVPWRRPCRNRSR